MTLVFTNPPDGPDSSCGCPASPSSSRLLAVVFVVEIDDLDLRLVDLERYAPIAGDAEAPCAVPIACQVMRFPARHTS